jgi:hypothetical protein
MTGRELIEKLEKLPEHVKDLPVFTSVSKTGYTLFEEVTDAVLAANGSSRGILLRKW